SDGRQANSRCEFDEVLSSDSTSVRLVQPYRYCKRVCGGRRACGNARRRMAGSEPLVFAKKAPLPDRQLGHRQPADADAFIAEHAQADRFTEHAQFARLRLLDRQAQMGFVLPAGLGLGQNLAAMADTLAEQREAVGFGLATDLDDELLFELAARI